MPVAHIAGIPIEETLLSLGGPAAIYLGASASSRRCAGLAHGFAR